MVEPTFDQAYEAIDWVNENTSHSVFQEPVKNTIVRVDPNGYVFVLLKDPNDGQHYWSQARRA